MKVAQIEIQYSSTFISDVKINSSKAARDLFFNNWNMDIIELQEEFKILYLNRSNNPLGIYTLSKGGIHGTVVDQRLLFASALKSAASSLILCHNHPSGNIKPSQEDRRLTSRLIKSGRMLDLPILDHLIITKDNYFSFADEGLLVE